MNQVHSGIYSYKKVLILFKQNKIDYAFMSSIMSLDFKNYFEKYEILEYSKIKRK